MVSRIFVLVTGLVVSSVSMAATTESLDLGAPILERRVPAGEPINIVITSKLPTSQYTVKTTVREIEIPALPKPGTTRTAVDCASLGDAFIKTVDSNGVEEKVSSEIENFRNLGQSCSAAEQANLEIQIASTTQPVLQGYVLNVGQELVVTVERQGRTWEFILSTGARGEWRTFYGFNFMPNGDEDYFTAQDPSDPTSFTITRKADREELDFAPSVIFSWKPASQVGKTWGHGLAMGLGFDLNNPIVFGGYGATYNENVTLTAGLVFHKQLRLDGRFEEGQTISENLDSNNLTIETYALNYYVGIGFRFGGSGSGNLTSP